MIAWVLLLVLVALGVGVAVGLAIADVSWMRRQQALADEEWWRELHAINHPPRHAIEAGVS